MTVCVWPRSVATIVPVAASQTVVLPLTAPVATYLPSALSAAVVSSSPSHRCLSDAEVRAYTEGPLAAALRGALDERVGDCAACRRAVQAHAPTMDASVDTLQEAGARPPVQVALHDRSRSVSRYGRRPPLPASP